MKFKELKTSLPGCQRNVLLKEYTSFKIGGPAKYFFQAKTKKELIKALKVARKFHLPFFILAGGSNVLASDQGFGGLVIKIQNSRWKIKNSRILVEAGTLLSNLVQASLKESLTGLEWAIGIPGTIGGAIRGNAGAFGHSTKEVVQSAQVLEILPTSKKGNFKIGTFKNSDCQFGYRESVFKKKPNLIIFSAQLKLQKGEKKKIKEKMLEYLKLKQGRIPSFPCAGSIFKNVQIKSAWLFSADLAQEIKTDIKRFTSIYKGMLPAGFLVEKCGLKGKKEGKAQISKVHGNIIVNLGGAKARDVLKLIKLIKTNIKEKFGMELEEEIEYLGFNY